MVTVTGEAGMALWWLHSPLTKVAQVWFPDPMRLCWFYSPLQGFFSGFCGFPPLAKTSMQLIPSGCKLCSKVTQGPFSGCQGRLCMLSVQPCWAASLLYFAMAISSDSLQFTVYTLSLQLRKSWWNITYCTVSTISFRFLALIFVFLVSSSRLRGKGTLDKSFRGHHQETLTSKKGLPWFY